MKHLSDDIMIHTLHNHNSISLCTVLRFQDNKLQQPSRQQHTSCSAVLFPINQIAPQAGSTVSDGAMTPGPKRERKRFPSFS